MAIRATARTSVVLFTLAFAASALRRRWPNAATAWLLRNRRQLGVSFAASHFVHLLLIIAVAGWTLEGFLTVRPMVTIVGGGLAYVFLALMTLTSFDTTAAWLGPRNWRRLHVTGGYYNWFIFAQSFFVHGVQVEVTDLLAVRRVGRGLDGGAVVAGAAGIVDRCRRAKDGDAVMTIAVIDYEMGNLRSVQKALERVGADAVITRDPDVIMGAAAAVLPGVGAFGACMDNLKRYGLDEPVKIFAASGRPFLGICVGMQILFDESEEFGRVEGLGVLPGKIVRFAPDPEGKRKVPQMGWNCAHDQETTRRTSRG